MRQSQPNCRRFLLAALRVGAAVVACVTISVSNMECAIAQTQSVGLANSRAPFGGDAPRDRLDINATSSGVAVGDGVRVVARSYETASIGAEINARITHLPQREGDRFRAGDVLVEFDCRKIVAEHDAAIATYRAHKAVYDNQRQLLRYHAAGTLAVDQTFFEMQKADADKRGQEAKRDGCVIRAPFDGRVTEKVAQVHEIAQPNQPLIKIINEGKLELVLMVPSSWLSRIAAGTAFSVTLDESGESHQARVVQTTGLIDPVSQSARLIAEIIGPSTSVVPGMSGTAVFTRREDLK